RGLASACGNRSRAGGSRGHHPAAGLGHEGRAALNASIDTSAARVRPALPFNVTCSEKIECRTSAYRSLECVACRRLHSSWKREPTHLPDPCAHERGHGKHADARCLERPSAEMVIFWRATCRQQSSNKRPHLRKELHESAAHHEVAQHATGVFVMKMQVGRFTLLISMFAIS